MESKTHTKTNTTEPRNNNLTCWEAATNPQCLQIETPSETYLFPYGYFRRAKLSNTGNKDTIEIWFQDILVTAKGKGLTSLCEALARLGVGCLRTLPGKYASVTKEGFITEIHVQELRDKN